MSKFNGSNDFNSTRFIFYERLKFRNKAYQDIGASHTNMRLCNFSDLNLYGKVDYDYNSVYLSSLDNLVQVDGQLMLSLVATAFQSMQLHFQNAFLSENISADEKFLSNLTCRSSFEDPVSSYSDYMNSIMYHFNETYLE